MKLKFLVKGLLARLWFLHTSGMRSRYGYVDPDGIYFLTSTVIEWLPAFTRAADFDLLISALAHGRRERGLKVYAFVIMDNHLHLVAEGPGISASIQAFKRYTAQAYLEQLEGSGRDWLLNDLAFFKQRNKTRSRYQVWQEGSHPQVLTTPEMVRQKVEYIHANPVRRGWVDAPEHWRYSSARNYLLGDHSVLRVDELVF